MADRTIIRGDSYATRRPLWTITLVDEVSAAFDLTGCTVRTTYKTTLTDPTADPSDTSAEIAHTLIVDGTGAATTEDGLYLVGLATAGVVEQRLTAAESRILPLGTALFSDIEVTDANGEIFTVKFADTLDTEEGVTHRLTG